MFKIIAVVCSIFSFSIFSQPTWAQSTTATDETIKELLQVMNTMNNMETSLEAMKDTIKLNSPYFLNEIKTILARDLPEADVQKAAEKYVAEDFGADRLFELFRYKFNLERIENEVMLPAYREHYSEEELKQLIGFYRSDLGRKILQLGPEISTTITSKTREISQMALNQAKEELAHELQKDLPQ